MQELESGIVALYMVLTIMELYGGGKSFIQYSEHIGTSLIEERNVKGSSDIVVDRDNSLIGSQGTGYNAQ